VGGKGFEKEIKPYNETTERGTKIITHMKSFIITFLLAIVAMAGQAKDIIWKNPSAFMGNYNGEFFITQVEQNNAQNLPVSAKISIFAAENKLKTCR
jgi:hypothetical protein